MVGEIIGFLFLTNAENRMEFNQSRFNKSRNEWKLVFIRLEIFCSTFEENGPRYARGFSHRFSRKKVRSFFSSDWKARVGEVN